MRLVALVSPLLLSCVLLAALPAGAQIIKVEPNYLNFGEMQPQELRTGTITVSNAGGGYLELRDVRPDCGCTVPKWEKVSLGPGQSTIIEIQFDSKNFSGRTIKMVHLDTNDPRNPVYDVAVQAMVINPLVLDPPDRRIKFGTDMKGPSEQITKQFTAMEAPALELRAERTRSGIFEVAVENNWDGDPRQSRLIVTRPADLAPGDYRDMVRVQTNLPDPPYVDLEIAARIVQELMVYPESVNFRFKKEFDGRLRVSPYPGKVLTYKVTDVTTDLPGLEYEILETIPNKETLILLTGGPIGKNDPRAVAADGKMKGTLRIFTDLPSVPVLEIEVSYMIRM